MSGIFRLVERIFTKHSQNVCLINIHILTYWHARCAASYGRSFDFIAFFGHFHILLDYLCLNCCISTKLSLIIYLINTDMSNYQMWLQVMECLLILLCFLYKINGYSYLKCCIPNFYGCLMNTFILICWYARCNYKLRKVFWFSWVLWKFQCLIIFFFNKFCGK